MGFPLGSNAQGLVIQGGASRIAYGTHTTVAAEDSVDTGLKSLVFCNANLESDPAAGIDLVSASLADQSAAATNGQIVIKGWQQNADTPMDAATVFGKTVYWIAIGHA